MKSVYYVAVIALLGMLLYSNTLQNKFLWDDEHYIYRNVYVKNFDLKNLLTKNVGAGAQRPDNFYRPLQMLSYAVIYKFAGLNVLPYHCFNICLHVLNSILIFTFLLKFVVEGDKMVAFVASLIFITHPVYTEAVTYINGTADPLYTFFSLLGLLCYAKYKSSKNNLYSAFTVLLCVLAVLSKETGIIYPVLLFTYAIFAYYKNKTGAVPSQVSKKADKKLSKASKVVSKAEPPLSSHKIVNFVKENYIIFICGAIMAVYFILRLTVLNFQNTLNFYGSENIYTKNLHYRIFTFIKVLLTYYGLLLFPLHLHMERTVPISITLDSDVTFSLFLLAIFAILLLRIYRKHPAVLYGAVWFYTALLPVSGIIPINILLSEHWLYLPSIGVWLVFSYIYNKMIKKGAAKYIIGGIGFLWLIFLSVRTIYRNRDWRDPITFYEQTLKYAPWSTRVMNNLAMAYDEKGDVMKALELYKRAIANEDIYPELHHNLANVYLRLNDVENAILEYKKAISMNPGFIHSYKRLAMLYINLHRYDEAKYLLNKALEICPEDIEVKELLKYIPH